MTKTIYLAGVPCSGKTTIFKKIREKLFKDSVEIKHKTLRALKSGNYYMFGIFDGSKFEGTDRLSMCVINDALEFIENLNSSKNKSVVFVEGDRLFNKRFLEATKACLFVTQVSPDLISLRHRSREDNQTERFLRSRQTKLDNIVKEYPCIYFKNNTNFDLELAVNRLCSTAKSFLVN